ncbi:Protein regulator of cytokinesis 1 [Myotis brandtii]|uniref:Protein regulator of cytokinesis 1 n=1 Tax=Myotis brandtii TaxID=109478 RepID=S7Q7S4_MYOBR|nr:Protein regulator of cytokinesis 1 [Myotis brandtii]
MMMAEQESLIKSIANCQKEQTTLCSELHVEPFQASQPEEFVNIKRQILLCTEELDHTPDTSFERDVVCEDKGVFCLSLENIAALQKLLQQLMSTWNMS